MDQIKPLETNIGFMSHILSKYVHPNRYRCELDRTNDGGMTTFSIYAPLIAHDLFEDESPEQREELQWLIIVPTYSVSPSVDQYAIHKVDGEKSEVVSRGPDNIQHLCRAAKELGIFIYG